MKLVNPVWAKYVAEQMPNWLEWFRNIHLKSYVELADKFIQLNPYYVLRLQYCDLFLLKHQMKQGVF